MGGPHGWQRFLQATYGSREGRAAFLAYREQKRLALAAPAKMELLDKLLDRHREDRVLIFTFDNATVYQIARRFLVPAITHQTKTRERRDILLRFHSGEYPILVTSQVLNEGVDVPAAGVGIVLSGTGSVREHVQRLGRLLREDKEKPAILYEGVAPGAGEEVTSDKRRQHHAYRWCVSTRPLAGRHPRPRPGGPPRPPPAASSWAPPSPPGPPPALPGPSPTPPILRPACPPGRSARPASASRSSPWVVGTSARSRTRTKPSASCTRPSTRG